MSAFDYYNLKEHIGHKIVCVGHDAFGDNDFENIAIECEDCGKVLFIYDFDGDSCPEGRDISNDCTNCCYGGEYHFEVDKCVARKE